MRYFHEVVAIVGSRDYPDIDAVTLYVRSLVPRTIVVTGGARGVDLAAATAARACRLPLIELKPDYAGLGEKAPLARNVLIARLCDRMVAFWDGKSTGTAHAMAQAKALGKRVELHKVSG